MCPNSLLKIAALAGGILLLSPGASAQKISAGVVGGGSLTDAYRDLNVYQFVPSLEPGAPPRLEGARFWSPSKDYVIGSMFEVRFKSALVVGGERTVPAIARQFGARLAARSFSG